MTSSNERSCWTCRWAHGDVCDRPHTSEEMDTAIDAYVVASGCHKNGGGMPIDRTVACPGHEAVLLMPHEALALIAEVERLRAEVAFLRACVPPTHPSHYGYEAWEERLRAEVAAERAAVVAWLREVLAEPSLPLGLSLVFDAIVDAIERGEHRREEEP